MLSTPGRIGVIAALPEELQSLLDAMPDAEPLQRAGRTFWVGHLQGRDIVAVLSRIGKVAAATTTTVLLTEMACQQIIFTGVAGGLLRDVLTGNVPYVFRPGELYATAALLGGVAYAVLYYFGIDSSTCFVTGFVVTLSVRLAAIRWNWNLPSYIPLFSPEAEPEAMEEEEKEILSGKPGGR